MNFTLRLFPFNSHHTMTGNAWKFIVCLCLFNSGIHQYISSPASLTNIDVAGLKACSSRSFSCWVCLSGRGLGSGSVLDGSDHFDVDRISGISYKSNDGWVSYFAPRNTLLVIAV